MNKKVLIISSYFPPVNAADMQRVRMSLPYFKQFGWDAEVVTVYDQYTEISKDDLLLQSVPTDIKIHKVKALSRKWTAKLGLGSLALRSLWYYKKKGNNLLKKEGFDLVYFSTTQFPVCILGTYWKKKFGVPYMIDMQDPWHSEYYRDKPKDQQPPKYWFSYRLNKYLEPIAMRHVNGLISVSESYIRDLKDRYPEIKNIPEATITFGAFADDQEIAKKNEHLFEPILDPSSINLVYIGRGGKDMHKAITPLFEAFKNGLINEPEIFSRLKIYFIGTSYAPGGRGQQTIIPLAKQFDVENHVIEITDRISYYHTLVTLQQADALFVPGSDDPKYTASKIYPYLLTEKPLLAIFHSQSSARRILAEYGVQHTYAFDSLENLSGIYDFFKRLVCNTIEKEIYHVSAIEKYSAKNMTRSQCDLFNLVISGKN